MTSYYMLIPNGSLTVSATLTSYDSDGGANLAVTDPRLLQPSELLDDPDIACVVLGEHAQRHESTGAPGCVLARLSPRGPVQPVDHRYAECPGGWTVEAIEPVDAMLGPQAAQIIPALREAERILVGEQESEAAGRYVEAVNAAYDAGPLYAPGTPLGDEAAAESALTQHGADGFWWRRYHPCVYGPEFTALAARDLIGTVPGWTQDAYDRLTAPWLAAFGQPIHPADTPAHTPAGHTA